LRWTHGSPAAGERSRVYAVEGEGGREGWFALRVRARGARAQIRDASLVDWSFARELDWRVAVRSAIDTVIERGDVDTLSVEGRADLPEDLARLGFRGRTHPAPTSFVQGRELASADLASVLVIATADRF
jgi:hypothetical protein